MGGGQSMILMSLKKKGCVRYLDDGTRFSVQGGYFVWGT